MYVNLNVLGSSMFNWIRGHVDGGHVVTIDKCGRLERTMKLLKKLTEPTTLCNRMSHSVILCFSTGSRDRSLALGRPRNQTVSIVDTIVGSRASRVRTASPTRIIISYQSGQRRGSEMKAKLARTTNIPKNTLHESTERHARGVQMKTNLLHVVGDIRTHQSDILKRTSKTPVFITIR
jgi:hypothetical protein